MAQLTGRSVQVFYMLDTDKGIPNIPESETSYTQTPEANVQVGASQITVTGTSPLSDDDIVNKWSSIGDRLNYELFRVTATSNDNKTTWTIDPKTPTHNLHLKSETITRREPSNSKLFRSTSITSIEPDASLELAQSAALAGKPYISATAPGNYTSSMSMTPETVSYTHLTLRRYSLCRSRWSPYH